jgi:hypothetical protein
MFGKLSPKRAVVPAICGDLGDGRERGGCARVGNDDVDAAEVVDRPRE